MVLYIILYTHTHTRTHTYTHTRTHKHTHTHTYANTRMHTHTHTNIYIYICMLITNTHLDLQTLKCKDLDFQPVVQKSLEYITLLTKHKKFDVASMENELTMKFNRSLLNKMYEVIDSVSMVSLFLSLSLST